MKKIAIASIVILVVIILSGCVEQQPPTATTPAGTPTGTPVATGAAPDTNISVEEKQAQEAEQGLQIVLKDVGFPEVKYLQPTIKEIQLKNEAGNWITIWSSSEGKTIKLTPDGAEIVLDRVRVEPGNYIETRMLVSSIDVEADINRDGDTLDKNVQIILTEEEFAALPHGEKPKAPSAPAAPQKPEAPPEPEKPSAPSQPSEPQLPPGVIKIEGGLVYMDKYLDEVHTVTPPYFDGIHNDTYFYPIFKTNFIYSGSGGKMIYDFTLHPLLPKHEQISVEVSTITLPPPIPTTVLLDDFNGTTQGKGFGALTYEDSLPNMGKAVNLAKGSYIKYSFSPWYKWDGAHNWNRNEASPGVLTEGKAEMWINPRQYTGISISERDKPSGILTFNWGDTGSAPQAGYIMHLGFTADGKLTYSVWGGNLDTVLVGKTTVLLNKWSHVAVSWSPNGTKLYLNGKVDADTSANVWPAFSDTVFVYLNYWGANDLGLVDDFRISKVAEPPTIVPPIIITENITENVTANVTADVNISSFTCSLTTVTDNYGNKLDYVRAIVKGTAQGPVGARVELPILVWSDDKFDCGNWTHKTGALIAVGHTCVRKEGQPETTSWTVDTGGEEQGGWLKGKSRSYSAKIYLNSDLNPQKVASKTTQCQY
jgi:hypothetical protein